MKTLRLVLCILVTGCAMAQVVPGPGTTGPQSSIVGQLQTATGGIVKAGTLNFTLSQPAIAAGTASVVSQASACYTSNAGNIVGLPDPQPLPIVSANTVGGSLLAGTYYVQIFYYNAANLVSGVSPENVVTLSSTGSLIISAPVFQPSVAVGYGVAISSTSGAESIQGLVTGWGQFTQAVTLTTGNPPQTTNNSTCNVWFSDALIPTGTYYSVSLFNKNGSLIAGFPQTWCTYGGTSGTIDVSQGAPTGNCNTKGVFYPTPIFSQPAGLSQSISGTLNLTGKLASTGTINLTSPGVFTGAQPNQYVSSLVGGIDPSIYHTNLGLVGWPTEAGHFGLAIPSNASNVEGDGITGEATTLCDSLGRTRCNAVGVGAHAQVLANNGAAFATNALASDWTGVTGASLTAMEADTVVYGSPALADGIDILLWPRPGSTVPSNTASNALKIGRGQNNGQWGQGIYIVGTSINPSGNAIYIDPACTAGPCSSAKITLGGFDAGSVARFGTLSVNQNGGIILTSTAGQPAVITSDGIAIPGSSSGTITLKNQSAAVGGTMLLPSPVGSGVLAQLIGSGTGTTAGTAIGSGAAQAVAITVTGATTTDVATCSTNASYPANWASVSVLPPIVTTDTVTLTIVNPSAGSVTPGAATFRCAVRR